MQARLCRARRCIGMARQLRARPAACCRRATRRLHAAGRTYCNRGKRHTAARGVQRAAHAQPAQRAPRRAADLFALPGTPRRHALARARQQPLRRPHGHVRIESRAGNTRHPAHQTQVAPGAGHLATGAAATGTVCAEHADAAQWQRGEAGRERTWHARCSAPPCASPTAAGLHAGGSRGTRARALQPPGPAINPGQPQAAAASK